MKEPSFPEPKDKKEEKPNQEEDCADQTKLDRGYFFLNTIAGFFDEPSPKTPPRTNDPLALFNGKKALPIPPINVTKSKQSNQHHERTISWGIPSVIDTNDQDSQEIPVHDEHYGPREKNSLLGMGHTVPMPPSSSVRPPLRPARSHKRTMTSTNMFDTSHINDNTLTNNMGSPVPLPAKGRHNRTMTAAQIPVSDMISTDHNNNHNPVVNQDTSSLSLTKDTTKPKPKIKLSDIVMAAPFELEAETHILRALEEQAEDNQKATSTGRADLVVLSHIPDDTVHDFFDEPPAETEELGHWTRQETPTLIGGEGGSTNVSEQGFEFVKSQNAHAKQPNIAPNKKETNPLLPTTSNTPATANKGNKKTQHRHTKSVECTLFGLTAAMTAMDEKNSDISEAGRNSDDDNDFDSDENSQVSEITSLPATDKVARAADTLARQLHKQQSVRNLAAKQPPEANSVVDTELTKHNNNDDNLETISVDEEEGQTTSASTKKTPSKKGEMDSLTSDETEEASTNKKANPQPKSKWKSVRNRKRNIFSRTATKVKDDWDLFSEVLSPRKASIYLRNVVLFLILPVLGIAAVLFYVFENPNTGLSEENIETSDRASISWWLLFLFVRQVITLSLALATQAIIIDFLAIGSWIFLRFFGPNLTLLLAQSKGWPFVLIWWGIYDLALLSGPSKFANHWGYLQDYIHLFNETNPSGNVPGNEIYMKILQIAIGTGMAVSLKRLTVGLFLGRQTFAHYGQELASVMKNMVLVSEVAGLAQEICRARDEFIPHYWNVGWNVEDYQSMMAPNIGEKDDIKVEHQQKAMLQQSNRLIDLLERWEEPDRARQEQKKNISISAVLQFRRAFTYMQRKYPFSTAFGRCDTRESCIESAQRVYEKLLLRTPDKEQLDFETIALTAMNDDGTLDEKKIKDLIKVFRPNRDGALPLLEFVKSVDNVYKSLRLLSATVANSGQIDQAFENILNIVFFIILSCVILSFLGYDPLALFFSLSSVILAFAFMFSSASAKYFEGMIFILVQRPYGVGDRIHVSSVEAESDPNGSSGWIVEKVSLFSTTVYWGSTNEYATMSNAAIANSRIINAARSPHAMLQVTMKFGIDVPFDRIVIFKSAVEQYMKARPREWLQLVGFRASTVTVDRGFIEYNIIALHREAWQSIGTILESRATLTSYCSEVAKQLDMRYTSPSLPVSLTVAAPSSGETRYDADHESISKTETDTDSIPRRDFRSMALSHGIKIEK